MNIDLLLKVGAAALSVASIGVSAVQSDRAQKRSDQLIKDTVKDEISKKQRYRKLGS